jgi:hypothetical protein
MRFVHAASRVWRDISPTATYEGRGGGAHLDSPEKTLSSLGPRPRGLQEEGS